MDLVLASTSERRIQLLRDLGLTFRTVDPGVDEASLSASDPEGTSVARARAKAQAVASREPRATVIAADTVVALGSELLGKARDAGEVDLFIRRLSGRTHLVVTAVAVLDPGSSGARVVADSAKVTFRRLTDEEVAWYVATSEGIGKAGGYAIQGLGGTLVSRVDGDVETVIGLPTALAMDMLGMGRG